MSTHDEMFFDYVSKQFDEFLIDYYFLDGDECTFLLLNIKHENFYIRNFCERSLKKYVK